MNRPEPDDRVTLASGAKASDASLHETFASTPSEQDTVDRDRQQFGNYEIIDEIARGGMGVVYRARQINADRIVALKLIRGSDPDPQELQRFQAEAKAVAKLDHPNIVPIYDVGTMAGEPFFAMKFVEGESLSQRLDGKPLDARVAAQLVRDVAAGIAHAHQHDIIHRDIKPGNVLLDARDTPLVTDFGLAKLSDEESDLTRTGQAIGTPAYMPPEQASGDRDKIDHRSDVYSLGAVLYACLTGRPPFQGSNAMATTIAVMKDEPVPPRLLNREVPRDLGTICLKCLSKDSANRYQTATDLHDELNRFLAGEPIWARPVSYWERTSKWVRRHPAQTLAIAVGLVAILAIITAITGQRYSARLVDSLEQTKRARLFAEQQRRETAEALLRSEVAETQTAEALDMARQAQAELQQVTYCQRIASARMAWDEGNVRDYQEKLSSTDPRQRGWEFQYLKSLGKPDAVLTLPGQILSLAISSDGNRLAAMDGRQAVTLFDLITQTALSTFQFGPEASLHASFDATLVRAICLREPDDPSNAAIEWWDTSQSRKIKRVTLPPEISGSGLWPVLSSSGRFAIAHPFFDKGQSPYGIFIGDFETGEFLIRREQPEVLKGIQFSQDEQRCLAVTLDEVSGLNRLLTYKLPEWTLVEEVDLNTPTAIRFNATSDFQTRLLLGEDRVFYRVDPETNDVVAESEPIDFGIHEMAFHPSGAFVALALTDGRILELSTEHLKQVADYRGMTLAANSVQYTPDGKSIWAGGRDKRVMRWDRHRAEQPRSIQTRHQIITIATSRDNHSVYHAHVGNRQKQGKLVCSDLSTGRSCWEQEIGDLMWVGVRPRTGEVLTLRWHDRRLQAWNATTGDPTWEIPGKHIAGIHQACFSADGKFCYSVSANQTIGVWDLEERIYAQTWSGGSDGGQLSDVAISGDNQRLFASGWDADQVPQILVLSLDKEDRGLIVDKILVEARPASIAHHPTEPWLAVATIHGQVMLYDSQSLDLLWSHHAHTDLAGALAFTPDGKRMVSASRSVALWEPRSGNQILKLRGHHAIVSEIVFTDDDQTMVSSDSEGVLKIWGEPRNPLNN